MDLLRPLTIWSTAGVLVASLAVGGAMEWRAHESAATPVVPTGLPASLTSPDTAAPAAPPVVVAPPVTAAPEAAPPHPAPPVHTETTTAGPETDQDDDDSDDDPPGDSDGDSDRHGYRSGQHGHRDYTPAQREMRRRVADALCDRYHQPRERCEQAARDNE